MGEDADGSDDDLVIVDETNIPGNSQSPPKESSITIKIRSRSGIHRHRMKLVTVFYCYLHDIKPNFLLCVNLFTGSSQLEKNIGLLFSCNSGSHWWTVGQRWILHRWCYFPKLSTQKLGYVRKGLSARIRSCSYQVCWCNSHFTSYNGIVGEGMCSGEWLFFISDHKAEL